MNRHMGAALLAAPIICGLLGTGCGTQTANPALNVQAIDGFPTTEDGIELGVSACYAALTSKTLWMAGGCNFPEIPAAEGGSKRFYQGIYLAEASADTQLHWYAAFAGCHRDCIIDATLCI